MPFDRCLATIAAAVGLLIMQEAAAAPIEDARFDALVKEAYQADLADDPTLRTERMLTTSEALWTPATDDWRAARARASVERLAALAQTIDRSKLSLDFQIKYDVYSSFLQRDLVAQKAMLEGYTVYNNVFEPIRSHPQTLKRFHRIENVEDGRNYISRLNGLSQILKDALAAGESRLERGIVMMKSNYLGLAEHATELSQGAPCAGGTQDHTLAEDLRVKLAASEIPKAQQQALIAEANLVLAKELCPAYAATSARLEAMAASGRTQGMWVLPDGAENYRDFVEFNLGDRVDPVLIHRRGLEEVDKIEAELKVMAVKIGLSGDVSELNNHLENHENLSVPNTDAGYVEYEARTNSYLATISKRLPDYFSHIPKQPLSVERALTGPLGSGPPSSGSFYTPAPADGSRPAIYNLAFPPGPDRIETWSLKTTTYHEGIPGHHLQYATAWELQGDANEMRRKRSIAAYGEGWALYAEQLAHEMGVYEDDDYGKIGWMQARLERAIRLVLDTGLNFLEWTPEQAMVYQREHLAGNSSIRRFLSWPGQALGYYWGYLEILDLRERAQAELSDKFDIKEFHDTILRHGPMPAPVMRKAVDHWIARVRSGG